METETVLDTQAIPFSLHGLCQCSPAGRPLPEYKEVEEGCGKSHCASIVLGTVYLAVGIVLEETIAIGEIKCFILKISCVFFLIHDIL